VRSSCENKSQELTELVTPFGAAGGWQC